MILDSEATYKAYDKEQIGLGIRRLPEQIGIAWDGTRALSLPANYNGCTNVVLVGMGGSALGPHILESVFFSRFKVPFTIVRGYSVPASVTSKTLVILSSFSGSTEEVLSAAIEAKKIKAKIITISAGGKLAAWAKQNKFPHYVFAPGDLAKQPRLGLGFSLVGVAGILERAGLLSIKAGELKDMVLAMNEVVDGCAVDVPSKTNPAKIVALELKGRAVIIVASEHLVGNAHAIANQINENAKQFAVFMEVSELNHHFMEGLAFPDKFFNKFSVIMLRSNLYNTRVQKRYDLTADVFERQGGSVIDYDSGGGSLLEEAGEVLQYGSFLSYYMAMQNKVMPEKIPFVDWFKEKLATD